MRAGEYRANAAEGSLHVASTTGLEPGAILYRARNGEMLRVSMIKTRISEAAFEANGFLPTVVEIDRHHVA